MPDLEAFAGELRATEKVVPRTRHVIALSIVDVDAIITSDRDRVTTMIMASLNPRRANATSPRRLDLLPGAGQAAREDHPSLGDLRADSDDRRLLKDQA